MDESGSITVITTRTVRPGCETEFERALHEFVRRSFGLTGQLGVHITRPAPGSNSREYGIVRKFRDQAAFDAFCNSAEYREWSQLANELTEGTARTEKLCGLESWFTLPGEVLQPLPKWKMAIATLLGVYPTSLFLAETVRRYTRLWPYLLDTLVFNVFMVAMLTWAVMPVVTRCLHGWLHPRDRKNLLGLMLAALLVPMAHAGESPSRPEYKSSRQDEDWSALRYSELRTDIFDPAKFIPLKEDNSAWLTAGGEVRERYEYFQNSNWGRGPQDEKGYLLQRYMFHFDVRANEHFRLFAQFKSGLENGRDGGPRLVDRDDFDLHQVFADGRISWNDDRSLTLRAGRQELAFGSQRLVSVREGPNVRLSFDGLRTTFRWDGLQLDALATRPVETKPSVFDDKSDPHTKFWGLYGVEALKFCPGANVDFYYLGLERDSAHFDHGAAHELRHSVGTRPWGKHGNWDWNFEFVYQFGKFGNGNISAWTAASDTGFTFAHAMWSPRLGFKADATSGDRNPNDRSLGTFNPLFPKGAYFGETGLIGPQNHIDLHPSAEFHPAQSVTFETDADFFWRESSHDGVYNIGQNVARSGRNGGSRYVGTQTAAQVEWRFLRHFTFTANYTHFFAGAFLHENLPQKDVNYASTWMTFRF